MSNIAYISSGRMTESEFDREYAGLVETYGNSAREANGKREQEFAKLFHRSNWNQTELARKLDKSQSYFQQQIKFGDFLENAMALNSENLLISLTERKFRGLWAQTDHDDDDRIRFRAVLEMLANPPPPPERKPRQRMITCDEVKTKLSPIVKGLKTEGRKNMATMVPAEVARLAVLLQRQIDEWTR